MDTSAQDKEAAKTLHFILTIRNSQWHNYYGEKDKITSITSNYLKLQDKTLFTRLYGGTPLQLAVESREIETIRLLLNLGADIYETGEKRQTLPMKIDLSSQYHEIYDLLKSEDKCRMNKIDSEGNTPLTRAVKQNWLPAISYLLQQKVNLVLKGPNGLTPLCAAIDTKQSQMIELIAKNLPKAELNNGLSYAIQQKASVVIMYQLLQLGADLYCKDHRGKTPSDLLRDMRFDTTHIEQLIQAIYLTKDLIGKTLAFDNLKSFIEADLNVLIKNDVVNTLLVDYYLNGLAKNRINLDWFKIVALNNTELLRYCTSKNKAMLLKELNRFNTAGDSLLTLALKQGNVQMVRFLVDLGANICQVNEKRKGALDIAVSMAKLDICKYLLQNVCQISIDQAFTGAIRSGNLAMVKLFVTYQANVNFINESGDTPLIEALDVENIDIVDFLIKKGASLTICDIVEGFTPLDVATDLHFEEGIKSLVQAGADPNVVTKASEELILHIFLDQLNFDMVYFLLEHGVDVNKHDKNHKCPLIKVVEMKHEKLVRLMLEKGADPFCAHFAKETLLSIAAKEQFIGVVKLLVERGANVKESREELQNLGRSNHAFSVYIEGIEAMLKNQTNFGKAFGGGNEEAPTKE